MVQAKSQVWVVSSGKKVDEYEYEGTVVAVYDASQVSLDDLETHYSAPTNYNSYERDEYWDECSDYDDRVIWDPDDGSCWMFSKKTISEGLS